MKWLTLALLLHLPVVAQELVHVRCKLRFSNSDPKCKKRLSCDSSFTTPAGQPVKVPFQQGDLKGELLARPVYDEQRRCYLIHLESRIQAAGFQLHDRFSGQLYWGESLQISHRRGKLRLDLDLTPNLE